MAKRKKLTLQQKEQNSYRREIRDIFTLSGFKVIPYVSDKEFNFKGRPGDFDDIVIYKNVIVCLEYTISKKTKKAADHLWKKKVLFDYVSEDSPGFIEMLSNRFPRFRSYLDDQYRLKEYNVKIVYCPKYGISSDHPQHVDSAILLEYHNIKYFLKLARAIKLSTKDELFQFLGIPIEKTPERIHRTDEMPTILPGTILPESFSNFDEGYKIISFYTSAKTILQKSYVLRKDGWNNSLYQYQRLIITSKINAIRKYLVNKRRVFINNIIVTLPSGTKILDIKSKRQIPEDINKPQSIFIEIPDGANTIGLIDGQHRVYAYHEGGKHEDVISKLREKQNLLVTGIVFPENVSELEQLKFQAELFLEINSNQANAKSDLKIAIGVLLDPFASDSIAQVIITHLNNTNGNPLYDVIKKSSFDQGKLPISSIILYGLKPLTKLKGEDSLFHLWGNLEKENLLKEDLVVLDKFILFSVKIIKDILLAFQRSFDKEKWTTDKGVDGRLLQVVYINAFLIVLRKLIANNMTGDVDYYRKQLSGIDEDKELSQYKSSQYGQMASHILTKYFDLEP